MKKTGLILICAAAVLLLGAAAVYAAVDYGSESDPLITKSYLDEIFTPQVEKLVESELEAALENAEIPENGGSSAPGDGFTVLTLSYGQRVNCQVGCEIMLRIGSAIATGPDFPVLVDTTSAVSLADGDGLITNHLYLVTIVNNGITAASDTVKVLIRGDYTVE